MRPYHTYRYEIYEYQLQCLLLNNIISIIFSI
jgi:hypothetical protein